MSPNWPVSLVNKAVPGGHRDRSEKPVGTPVDVLQVKVSLRGMRPPIWRLEVPARITLAGLQAVLQAAFGWIDGHLHGFEVSARGRRPRLESLAVTVADQLVYRYDFGDDWTHPHKGQGHHAAGDLRRRPTGPHLLRSRHQTRRRLTVHALRKRARPDRRRARRKHSGE
jgi:hypothetical protein